MSIGRGGFFVTAETGEGCSFAEKSVESMITIDYLRRLLAAENNGLAAVTDPEKQVIDSPDILAGLDELAQRKGLPFAVLFEEAFHYDDDDTQDVPVTRFTQSIYVMRMADGQNPKRPEEMACFADVKHIRALLLARQGAGDAEMQGWDRRAQRDFVSGAANYVGWKLRVTFTENESWEVPEPPTAATD